MFDFTKEEYEMLCEKAMLNDELRKILELKIKGYSIVQIASKVHLSERTTNRRINKLKKKILKVI